MLTPFPFRWVRKPKLGRSAPSRGDEAGSCHRLPFGPNRRDDRRQQHTTGGRTVTTVVVRRPSRRPAPEMPSGELVLEAPPEIPAASGRQWTQALMMLPMLAMMGAMVLLFNGSALGAAGGLRCLTFGLFGVAMLGMVVLGFINNGGPSK